MMMMMMMMMMVVGITYELQRPLHPLLPLAYFCRSLHLCCAIQLNLHPEPLTFHGASVAVWPICAASPGQ
jgi:hypothetical protein